MKLHSSGEDYLKAIYILQKEKGTVRSIDVAEQMGVSKPSVSHAVKLLREGGFIVMDDDYTLHLTDLGCEIAEKLYERHQYFTEQLTGVGVDVTRWQIPVISNRGSNEGLTRRNPVEIYCHADPFHRKKGNYEKKHFCRNGKAA